MKLRPEEITALLKERIKDFDVETDLAEVGQVLQVRDGIARVYGLESAVALEMLELEHGVTGVALNLEEDNVGAALLGEWDKVKEGEPVRRTGRVASVPVGEELVGRIVDPLGNPVDGGPPLATEQRRPLEFKAPGVVPPPETSPETRNAIVPGGTVMAWLIDSVHPADGRRGPIGGGYGSGKALR